MLLPHALLLISELTLGFWWVIWLGLAAALQRP